MCVCVCACVCVCVQQKRSPGRAFRVQQVEGQIVANAASITMMKT